MEYKVTEMTVNGHIVRIFDPIRTPEQEEERKMRIENALRRIGREMVRVGII